MGLLRTIKTWSAISATPATFILNGGLYAITAHAGAWTSYATGTLAFATDPADADTVTLGASTYRFKNTMAQANDVKRESTAAATLAHLVKTINGTGLAGTDYFAGSDAPNASASAVKRANRRWHGGNYGHRSVIAIETKCIDICENFFFC